MLGAEAMAVIGEPAEHGAEDTPGAIRSTRLLGREDKGSSDPTNRLGCEAVPHGGCKQTAATSLLAAAGVLHSVQ